LRYGHFYREGIPELWFPPTEVRTWDVDKQGKFDTPVDELGLVDLDALVQLGKITVHDGYDWTSPLNDVHHLQWPAVKYAEATTGDGVVRTFRELVCRKAFIPRRFHNWLHYITVQPALPSQDVMRHAVSAERTARAIATTAQLAMRLTRMPHIPEDKLVKRLEEEFDNYLLYVENAREVPEEFQLLKLAEIEVATIDEMLQMSKPLGKLALDQVPVRYRALKSVV